MSISETEEKNKFSIALGLVGEGGLVGSLV